MKSRVKPKLVRITTVPISLEKLLEGQLTFMSQYFDVIAMSAEPERLKRYGEANSIRVKSLPLTRKITPFRDLKAIWLLYKFFRDERPDIVHTHTPKAGLVGMVAARLAKVPNRLHTIAGLPVMETKGFKRWVLSKVEQLTYAMATKVYPNSFELKRYIIENAWAKPEQLHVLHNGSSNGIDTGYFNPTIVSKETQAEWRSKLAIQESDFVFIFVGRLVGDKGINELVRAFALLRTSRSDIHLILVGPLEQTLDPLEAETLASINDDEKIHSLGYQEDVRPFFAISHALVFPSYREGFPNVVMQAGSMNLPAIVSNINGCNEIIQDGKNGIIIPVKQVEPIYEAMKALIEDAAFTARLREGSRSAIVERYSRAEFWEVLLQEYNSLF